MKIKEIKKEYFHDIFCINLNTNKSIIGYKNNMRIILTALYASCAAGFKYTYTKVKMVGSNMLYKMIFIAEIKEISCLKILLIK